MITEQDLSCDSPPYSGSRAVYANVRWTFESEQQRRVTPLSKGLSRSDWGLRQMDFEEILNDSPTDSLVLSKTNPSD